MPATSQLTDMHLVILSQAAQRADLRVLPTPPSLAAKAGAATRALKSLLARGLVREEQATSSDQEWRCDDGKRLTLALTPAGLAAIGLEPADQNAQEPEATERAAAAKPGGRSVKRRAKPASSPEATQKPATKTAALTALLERKHGATINELAEASGWQAHSVRGFLSGTLKKKLGYTITSARGEDGTRRYRITA